MLNLHFLTSAFHRTEKGVLLIAYGVNAARLILPNKSDCSEPIPPGRIYYVKGTEVREIVTLNHREAIVKVVKEHVYFMTTYLEEQKLGDSLQAELKDEVFKKMKQYHEELQRPAEWIEVNRAQLINFVA